MDYFEAELKRGNTLLQNAFEVNDHTIGMDVASI